MTSPTKSPIDTDALGAHLNAIEDMDEEDGYEASNAVRSLEQVRRMFYGTPWESVLTDAIVICDAVARRAEDLG